MAWSYFWSTESSSPLAGASLGGFQRLHPCPVPALIPDTAVSTATYTSSSCTNNQLQLISGRLLERGGDLKGRAGGSRHGGGEVDLGKVAQLWPGSRQERRRRCEWSWSLGIRGDSEGWRGTPSSREAACPFSHRRWSCTSGTEGCHPALRKNVQFKWAASALVWKKKPDWESFGFSGGVPQVGPRYVHSTRSKHTATDL